MTAEQHAPPLERILETALEAARGAGRILFQGYDQPKSVRHKGEIDLVTQYDLASERYLVDQISTAFPGHAILAEEGGQTGLESPFRWYIDPLDGTTNYAHGFPVFCVSIAFEALTGSGPQIQVGVVHDPLRNETYSSVKEQGTWLNGRRVFVSRQTQLDQALVATGFPYDIRRNPGRIFQRFQRMCLSAQGVRRAGSAALDLASVAAGRLDGFWEEHLAPWDTAAGMLLVLEAGGKVTDFQAGTYRPQLKEIIATNGRLHYNMIKALNPEQPEGLDKAAIPWEVGE
ncbi:MAG: inositol monophosphatase family protein [Pseudomonadota bacterium]